ncbi:MAG TPA: MFS transporter [Dermatophilaceae bacterium]|nr:MFS transporter [Dermatophilaceae bacterium]HQH90473.1 MFS transporter [Dermatophilaceae bacterium]
MDTGEPAMRDAGADPGSRLGAAAGPGAGTGAAGEPQPRQPLRNDATDQPALVEVASERARRAAAVTGRATARAGKAAGRATAGASKATAKGVVVGAKFMGRGAKAGTERFRLFARSEGAAESGLSRVTEMQVLASAGDAAFTVALASTILALPLGQARGQVALFLVTTMAPFVVLAPLVGPLLDRWRHGRRWAIGTTLALRAFLSWVLAGVVADGSPWLLPLALLCLMATRAYAVALSAGIPLVRPDAISLVTANSRQSVATLMGMLLGAAVAAPIGRFGAPWSLRVAFLIYIGATVLAIRLPAAVDSQRTPPAEGPAEAPATESPGTEPPATEPSAAEPSSTEGAGQGRRARARELRRSLPAAVRAALATASGAKALSGFVTLFLSFLLWDQPLPGISSVLALGLVVAAAGVGNALGSFAGNRIGDRSPTVIASAGLLAAIAVGALVTAYYSVPTLILLGLVSGAFGQLAKLCLDALIQDATDDETRAQVFSWSETRLQAAWVGGGALGIAMPLIARLGFGAVTAMLVGVLVAGIVIRSRSGT